MPLTFYALRFNPCRLGLWSWNYVLFSTLNFSTKNNTRIQIYNSVDEVTGLLLTLVWWRYGWLSALHEWFHTPPGKIGSNVLVSVDVQTWGRDSLMFLVTNLGHSHSPSHPEWSCAIIPPEWKHKGISNWLPFVCLQQRMTGQKGSMGPTAASSRLPKLQLKKRTNDILRTWKNTSW